MTGAALTGALNVHAAQLSLLNRKMEELLKRLREAQRRRALYTRFSESPVQAINEIIATNSKELRNARGGGKQCEALSKACGLVSTSIQRSQCWCRRCTFGASGWRTLFCATCLGASMQGDSRALGFSCDVFWMFDIAIRQSRQLTTHRISIDRLLLCHLPSPMSMRASSHGPWIATIRREPTSHFIAH